MNWKTVLNLDLIADQSNYIGHYRTVRTLEDLIQHDPAHAELYRGCLEKLRTGYDL